MSYREADNNLLRNSELWSGFVALAISGFIAWSGHKLGVGSVNDPGSGFAIFYAGLFMCVLALLVVMYGFTERGRTVASLWQGTQWKKPIVVIVCLLAFAASFETIGFLLATILLLLTLFRVITPVRWVVSIPVAVLVPLVVWWVLVRLLLIQLPSGIFGAD